MKYIHRLLMSCGLAAALAGSAAAQCIPTLSSIDNVSVALMPASGDEIERREFVEITDDLAVQLGIAAGDVDADREAPNPQIRVRIETSPANSGITTNNAVFTVVALRATPGVTLNRIFVYRQSGAADKDSGQFKLLAKSDGSLLAVTDANLDDVLDNVTVRVFTVPVASSTFTNSLGSPTTTTFYCDPSSSQSYHEKAIQKADDTIAVIAPHGGNIEAATSTQATRFAATFESLVSTPVNVWNLEGKWGNNQTFERWHITSTSIDEASYPGLADLLPSDDAQFDHAVSFHGFGGSASANCVSGPFAGISKPFFQIILGGGAPRNLKCAIAHALDDAMVAASRQDAVAISIRDSAGNINIVDHCGRNVSQSGLDGTHADNIVNRIASNGGIQLEQSKTLRDDAGLPNLVADAVADGYADFLANPLNDFCVAPY